MKLFFAILILLTLIFSAPAQQIITATITITNSAGTTNGQNITVNGTLRTWTNIITSPAIQILTATNIPQSWTNLFLAYAVTPEAGLNLFTSSSNVVQFQSFAGVLLTASLSAGWGIIAFSTNSLTPAIVVRVPRSAVGIDEQTNVESGLIDYLNDNKATNKIGYTVTNIWVSGVSGITNTSGYVTNLTVIKATNIFRVLNP